MGKKIIGQTEVEWALVLEDDASIASMSPATVQGKFNEEAELITSHYPDWGIIYLGGHISSSIKPLEKKALQITEFVNRADLVYQTHAFVIRRCIAPDILKKLQQGFAADAAIVSWSRANAGRCFVFHPYPLLQQPGRA